MEETIDGTTFRIGQMVDGFPYYVVGNQTVPEDYFYAAKTRASANQVAPNTTLNPAPILQDQQTIQSNGLLSSSVPYYEMRSGGRSENIVDGLFNPELINLRNQRNADLQANALAFAKLDPFQKASYGIYQGAGQLAGLGASAMGVQDPQMLQIQQQAQLLSGVNMNDPASLEKAAMDALRTQNRPLAINLLDRLKTVQDAISKRALDTATATEKMATAQKLTREFSARAKTIESLQSQFGLNEADATAIANNPALTEKYLTPTTAKTFDIAKQGKHTPESIATFNRTGNYADLDIIDKQTKTTSEFLSKARELGFLAHSSYGDYSQDEVGKINTALLQDKIKLGNKPEPAVTPVTVIDPKNPSRTIVIDGRTGRVLGQGLKEPSVGIDLSSKEKQAREAKFPAATTAIKVFETNADRLATDLETLANHKGLSGISGLIYGITPSITKEARAAQALYNSIIARGGFQELQNLRNASPTGGALGNVSNQEGQQLKDAFGELNRTQNTEDLKTALLRVAAQTKIAKQRVREGYDLTYEYRQPKTDAVVDFGSLK